LNFPPFGFYTLKLVKNGIRTSQNATIGSSILNEYKIISQENLR
jgi:hypothetical protein